MTPKREAVPTPHIQATDSTAKRAAGTQGRRGDAMTAAPTHNHRRSAAGR